MTREEILSHLIEMRPDAGLRADDRSAETIIVDSKHVLEVARILRDDPKLAFDYLMVITASDWIDRVDVFYSFMSYTHLHTVALKVQLPNERLEVDSLTPLWPSANWFEREAYDLFGVRFTGHPDLRRILMPQDWVGHPLRKSYRHPNLVPTPQGENPAEHTGMGHHKI